MLSLCFHLFVFLSVFIVFEYWVFFSRMGSLLGMRSKGASNSEHQTIVKIYSNKGTLYFTFQIWYLTMTRGPKWPLCEVFTNQVIPFKLPRFGWQGQGWVVQHIYSYIRHLSLYDYSRFVLECVKTCYLLKKHFCTEQTHPKCKSLLEVAGVEENWGSHTYCGEEHRF